MANIPVKGVSDGRGLSATADPFQEEVAGGQALIAVRADILLPYLAVVRKFFKSIDATNRHGMPTRFQNPDGVRMTLTTLGFTPEDFNAMMAMNNNIGVAISEMGYSVEQFAPKQMAHTKEFQGRMTGKARAELEESYGKSREGDEADVQRGGRVGDPTDGPSTPGGVPGVGEPAVGPSESDR